MQAVHALDEIANPLSQATLATLPAKGILIPINSIQLSNPASLPGNAGLQLGIVLFPLGEVIRCAAGDSCFHPQSSPVFDIEPDIFYHYFA